MDEIFLTGRLHPLLEESCRERFRICAPDGRRDAVRALVTSGSVGASAALIDSFPRLEVIVCFGVGVDAIDLEAARRRGIPVTNTPGVLNDAVADLALALLLAVTRGVVTADRFVREGRWAGGSFPVGAGLSGKLLGIAGLGGIGHAVARRAEAFGLRIAYFGRTHQQIAWPFYANLSELAAAADFLALTLPGGASTHHVVDGAVLDALGPRGVLINVARGSVVDQAALIERLRDGRVGGAGLDVFTDEPRVPHELLALDNVVLLPHVGSGTAETREAMARLTFDNLVAHFAGRPLLTPVGG